MKYRWMLVRYFKHLWHTLINVPRTNDHSIFFFPVVYCLSTITIDNDYNNRQFDWSKSLFRLSFNFIFYIVNMARMLLDISQLPQDVLTYTNKRFFDIIESFCGKDEADLLSIQAIWSVDSFLSIEDVYSIFTVDSEDVIEIQTRCAFKNRNGTFTVKPGIKSSLNYFNENWAWYTLNYLFNLVTAN